jgi:hypothetical protein
MTENLIPEWAQTGVTVYVRDATEATPVKVTRTTATRIYVENPAQYGRDVAFSTSRHNPNLWREHGGAGVYPRQLIRPDADILPQLLENRKKRSASARATNAANAFRTNPSPANARRLLRATNEWLDVFDPAGAETL